MQSLQVIACLATSLSVAAYAATIPANTKLGAEVFNSQKCVFCHSVKSEGGDSAPDLARRPDGRYSPATMAATLWNHTPQMWKAMEAAGINKPKLSEEQSAGLFAFFYAFRYFEDPGDAGRGKRVLDSKGCVGCHGQSQAGPGEALPVSQWESLTDPIQLARAMWNHAPKMRETMSANMSWPELTAQEMTDLLVYIQNIPEARKAERKFSPASAADGEVLFQTKGCSGCHTGSNSLEEKHPAATLAEFAAAMWNHAPEMRESAQELLPEEMTRLVGYLWSIQYFDDRGDPARGLKVLTDKKCGSCHGAPGQAAPGFATLSGEMDSIRFVSDTWKHGPEMLRRMRESNLEWPRFRNRELSDLLAYINSL